jgi:hypothetical protein
MLPFTREAFFEVFAAYNAGELAGRPGGLPPGYGGCTDRLARPPWAGRVVGSILVLMWAWVGLIYHVAYFSQINPAARLFAVAFLLQAALFALAGATRGGLQFRPKSPARAFVGAVLVAYAMVAYPVIGLAVGERYPALPLFGVTPCPLLIFTFGILLWVSLSPWWLWIVPLLWALIGGSAAILLSVPQDWALPISAAAALLIYLSERRRVRMGR